MVLIRIQPAPAFTEKEHIRVIVGFYRGVGIFVDDNLLSINPKKDFDFDNMFYTLQSSGYQLTVLQK